MENHLCRISQCDSAKLDITPQLKHAAGYSGHMLYSTCYLLYSINFAQFLIEKYFLLEYLGMQRLSEAVSSLLKSHKSKL